MTSNIKEFIKAIAYFVLLPVLKILNMMIKVCIFCAGYSKVCALVISLERIGHQALDCEVFTRMQYKNKGNSLNLLLCADKNSVANRQLLRMIARKMPVLSGRIIYHTIMFLCRSGGVVELIYPYHMTNNEIWDQGKPQLFFTEDEQELGYALLNSMNVGFSEPFVCFHSRDSLYLDNKSQNEGKNLDWTYHNYRDCNIANYLDAADYLINLGVYAIRMGEVVSTIIGVGNPMLIDYASQYRSDFGDIYLMAKCKYFLGNTAGLMAVATIFNVPVALANFIPIGYTPLSSRDIFIPKKLWLLREKRFLTFREIIAIGADSWLETQNYVDAGIEVVENTAEEILALAVEMNARLDGTWQETEEDRVLQTRYRKLFKPEHRCYGFKARMGAQFLRDNQDLLD